MTNPQALETFGRYDKKSLMAGIVVGQGLKGRARAPQMSAPAGFPQELWDAAAQRANNMIASTQGAGQSSGTPTEATPDDWQFDKDAFCFGIAAGRSLEGWEIDGVAGGAINGWGLDSSLNPFVNSKIMYYIHLDSPGTITINFYSRGDWDEVFINFGESDDERFVTARELDAIPFCIHYYQNEGDYIITIIGVNNILELQWDVHFGATFSNPPQRFFEFAVDRFPDAMDEALLLEYGSEAESDLYLHLWRDIAYGGVFSDIPEKELEALRAVYLDGYIELWDGAFANCKKLTGVTLSNHTEMHTNVFAGCEGLKNITIPDGLVDLGFGAFFYCTNLESVRLGRDITRIPGDAFMCCYKLKEVITDNTISEIDDFAFALCSSFKDLVIPHGVQHIGDCAFAYCENLVAVTLPESVTTLGSFNKWDVQHGVFQGCSSLTSCSIPDSVISIGDYTFALCYNLTNITIPNSVTRIGSSAFYGCVRLANIVIPDSVTVLRGSVFVCCYELRSITISNANITLGGNLFTPIGLPGSSYHHPIDVYYSGTETQWRNNGTMSDNFLEESGITIHYNSTGPDDVHDD